MHHHKKEINLCHLSHLLVKTVAKLGDAALDLIKLTALLSSVSLDDVHGYYLLFQINNEMKAFSEQCGGLCCVLLTAKNDLYLLSPKASLSLVARN